MRTAGNSNQLQRLRSLLVQSRTQIMKYLPRHLDADNMIYVALETVRADSYLRQCERQSIVQAVIEAAQLGLMLGNKLGHAYLVPRREKKTNTLKCQLPLDIGASLLSRTAPARSRASTLQSFIREPAQPLYRVWIRVSIL